LIREDFYSSQGADDMKISIILAANTADLETDMDRAAKITQKRAKEMERALQKTIKGIESDAKKIAATLTLVGGALFAGVIKNTLEAEKALSDLERVLKSTGNTSGFTSTQLVDYAKELQKITIFGDDAIVSSMALLAQFQNIRGEIYTGTLQAVLDMASATGEDLPVAMQKLATIINDPIKGLRKLNELGITFTDTQKKQAKELIASGNGLELQKMLLEKLEEAYGGSAEAAAGTFGGSLKQLKNTIGDLLEGDSATISGVTSAVKDLNTLLNSQEFKDGIAVIVKAMLDIARLAAEAIPKVANFGIAIGEGFALRFNPSKLDKLYQDLNRVETSLEGGRNSVIGFGLLGGIYKTEEKLVARRIAIQKEIALIEKSLDFVNRKQAPVVSDGPPAPSSTTKKPLDFSGGGTGEAAERARKAAADKARREAERAAKEAEREMERIAAAQDAALQSIVGLNQGLEQQVATFNKSEAETLEYRLTFGDLKDEINLAGESGRALIPIIVQNQRELTSLADAAENAADQESYLNRLRDEAIGLIESNRTELEILASQMSIVSEAYARGVISAEAFAEAQQIVEERVAKANEKASEGFFDMEAAAEEASRRAYGALSDFLFDPFENGLDGMLRGFVQTLHKMASESLASAIFSQIFGPPGANGAGGLAGFITGIFGGTRDSGGPGQAGKVYAIGTGAQPEYFVPNTAGQFIPNADRMMGGKPEVNVKIINVEDERRIGDYMSSPNGDKAIINAMRRNAGALRSVLT
jgi:hypothetical protein